MSLLEAIRTNKPFRRAHWLEDVYLIYAPGFSTKDFVMRKSHVPYHLSVEDIKATDWEVE